MAQELGTTPDTASAAFNRLRYAMAVETNTTSQPVSDNNKSESKASTVSRQDTGELRNMGKRFDTLLGTASATTNRLNYVTDAPERGTSPKLGMTCGTSAEETILDKDKDGTASRAECNAGFDSFDTDENDYITAKEFSAVAHQGFVFDVNCLVLDESHVIFSAYNKEVFDYCRKHKIEPIISELRHSYFWDGGISCCTQDIRRRGGLETYL